jgi:hypothetical protein
VKVIEALVYGGGALFLVFGWLRITINGWRRRGGR